MKQINKVAVLGAGVMGSTIAAHLANAGIRVLLLDIVPKEPNEAEKKAGLTLNDPAVRNRIAMTGLEGLRKMKPAAFFLPAYASYIEAGNFDDDIKRLQECDWVIEVVIEKMEIKKRLFSEKVVPEPERGHHPLDQHERTFRERDGRESSGARAEKLSYHPFLQSAALHAPSGDRPVQIHRS